MSATQPDRVFLNSSDDINEAGRTVWSDFTLSLPSGVLNATSCMPLRCTIPNISGTAVIPDYELVFWYETSPDNSTWTLHNVRLYPSFFNPSAGYTTYSRNTYFASPSNLITALNVAAATGGDISGNNPYYVPGDVTFSFNASTNKVSVVGNIANYYRITGWNSPKITVAVNSNNLLLPNAGSKSTEKQQIISQFNLNLRLGFAMSGNATWKGITSLATAALQANANQTNLSFATNVPIEADTFPNMVYTQNIFVYADFLEASTLSSNNQRNLLFVIPVNAPPLGVINYSAPPLFNYIYHLNRSINSIKFTLLDDANQPFYLPDNANVNVEIGFRYN